jgi:hypothetical protein
MTEAKKLKQAIRVRSRKTGESYTAARRQLLASKATQGSTVAGAREATPKTPRPATARASKGSHDRQEIGDAAIMKKTGHGYGHWFAVLDSFDAEAKGHAASASHLRQDHGVPGWHSQMITVAYERARGLRAVNQSCAGDFQVSVSKTVPASVSEVAKAFDGGRRAAWLQAGGPDLAGALNAALSGPKRKRIMVKDARSARLRYAWSDTTVEIRIAATPKGSASVVADNTKLPNSAAVAERRALWRAALESLRAQFAG